MFEHVFEEAKQTYIMHLFFYYWQYYKPCPWSVGENYTSFIITVVNVLRHSPTFLTISVFGVPCVLVWQR